MRVEAAIAPKEPLSQTDFRVMDLLANNYTHSGICRELFWHKAHLWFVKQQIARKMREKANEETEDGVCKAIAWAVANSKIGLCHIPEPASFSSLDDLDTQLFLLMGRGSTKAQIAERLGLDPVDVVKGRERVHRKLGLATIYAAAALSAYGLKQAGVV